MRKPIGSFLRTNKVLVSASILFGLSYAAALRYERPGEILLYAFSVSYLLYLVIRVQQERRLGTYSPDIITVIAAIATLAVGKPVFAALALLIAVLRITLVKYATARTERELAALADQELKTVRMMRGRKEITMHASDIQPGQKISVRTGETIPIDGIDENNTHHLSGTKADENLILRTLETAEQSYHQSIARLARSALRSSSPFIRVTERYVPVFMIMSLLAAGAGWYLSADTERFAAILLTAAPTALVFAAPLALRGGLSSAARQNIYFRTGSALERLARTKKFYTSLPLKLSGSLPVIEQIARKTSIAKRIHILRGTDEHPHAYLSSTDEEEAVLNAADIGIMLDTSAVSDSADIVIASTKQADVERAFSAARRTVRIAFGAVLFGSSVSVAAQLLVLSGVFTLEHALLSQLVIDLAVLLVALRAHRS